MKTRTFGNTEEQVSILGFGAASISGEGGGYGFGLIQEQKSIELLHHAFDAKINLYDTAPIYGFGTSEERIGKAFRDRRHDVFLVSKSGVTWDREKRVTIDNSPAITERMLHDSLRRLNTDYIDAYLIHWPDPNIDIRHPMEVLARAKEQGKIRFIGLSNTFPEDIQKAQEIERIDILQSEFNLFQNAPQTELFPLLQAHQMGLMSWGTLDKGILTGRVTPERIFEDPTDVRHHAPWWTQTDRTPKYKAMEQLLPFLHDVDCSPRALALAYVLQFDEVTTALCGPRNHEQLETLLEALEQRPHHEILEEAHHIAHTTLRKHTS